MHRVLYEIYVDLDGVLVDFHQFAVDQIGFHPNDWELDRTVKKQFWKGVDQWIRDGKKFFEAMQPMEDAFVLWNHIEQHNPCVLSATGHVKHAEAEKRAWVRQHLGEKVPTILVRAAADKAVHAAPHRILIDDREKAIGPWRQKGGIGVLHTSAEDTIQQLRDFGL